MCLSLLILPWCSGCACPHFFRSGLFFNFVFVLLLFLLVLFGALVVTVLLHICFRTLCFIVRCFVTVFLGLISSSGRCRNGSWRWRPVSGFAFGLGGASCGFFLLQKSKETKKGRMKEHIRQRQLLLQLWQHRRQQLRQGYEPGTLRALLSTFP